MAILEVAQLEKSFGGTKVLRDISFSLEEGQALSIIGSSGSGKTTLLRCLNFLETPDSGRIAVRGRNLLDGSLSPQEPEAVFQSHRFHPPSAPDLYNTGWPPYRFPTGFHPDLRPGS